MRQTGTTFGVLLKTGLLIEVNMQVLPEGVDGAGINSYCCYPACLVAFDVAADQAQIYMLHDVSQTLYTVSMKQIAKATLPLPTERFNPGDLVEIQYRVGITDEYGWWSATVMSYDPASRQYRIQWYNTQLSDIVPQVRVRNPAFVPVVPQVK
jgi:hypothetical protein